MSSKEDAQPPQVSGGGGGEAERIGALVRKWSASKAAAALQMLSKTEKKGGLCLLALVNPKAGGLTGEKLLGRLNDKSFNKWGYNAFNLPPAKGDDDAVAKVLARGYNGKSDSCRLVCGGGDGTSAWCVTIVVNVLLTLGGTGNGGNADLAATLALPLRGMFELMPTFIMCPLGTGNDLSRTIGWGHSYPGGSDTELSEWLQMAAMSPAATRFDVWQLRWHGDCRSPEEFYQPKLDPHGAMMLFLYLGTGWDAYTMGAFERRGTQFENLAEHLKNGLISITQKSAQDFGVRCLRGCQDKDPKLAAGASLMVLNTPSVSAGAFAWGTEDGQDGYGWSRVFDKKLEIVKSEIPAKAGVLKFVPVPGLHLRRQGQSGEVVLSWTGIDTGPKGGRPFQVDGEPFQCLGPGVVKITHGGQIRMGVGPYQDEKFGRSVEMTYKSATTRGRGKRRASR